jgi:hypothetical protein
VDNKQGLVMTIVIFIALLATVVRMLMWREV